MGGTLEKTVIKAVEVEGTILKYLEVSFQGSYPNIYLKFIDFFWVWKYFMKLFRSRHVDTKY